MNHRYFQLVVVLFLLTWSFASAAQSDEILGRWDFVCTDADGKSFPSWLEVRKSGHAALVGSFVGQFGSARPVSKITENGSNFSFSIPPQWEQRTTDMQFTLELTDGKLNGETTDEKGGVVKLAGSRAPALTRIGKPQWREPIELFNGKDLSGWTTQLDGVPNGWVVRDGFLYNQKPGQNLVTEQQFDDFKLHAEFRYPNGSNGGIYLRGRYEAQIEDNYGGEAECHKIGGIYGFLTPSLNASKPAGYWQTYDITLVGRTITIELNGERVVDRQAIPGITGGALDSNEDEPGPILLQGDHGPIEFRKLTITPASVRPTLAKP
ncbi:MAG: DUF1080 domain-containing protein [Planctomycetales bacterium]|nr:DUF1080 domain-containing protein [Planctomycetales bacterium]